MSARVTCPACGRVLRVASDEMEPLLTCPSCLAEVANPNPTGPREPSVYALAPETVPAKRLCPQCGSPVETAWRFCPHCEFVLKGSPVRKKLKSADAEARTDWNLTRRGLGVLIALGAIGVLFLSCGGLGRVGVVHLGSTGILFVLVLVAGLGLRFGSADPEALGIGRLLRGLLEDVAIELGCGLLVVLIIVALIVVLVGVGDPFH